jgi:hypothetical protein
MLTGVAVAAPILPLVLSRATVAGILGALTAVALAARDPSATGVATTVAATVWLGGICHLATAPVEDRRRSAQRLLPWILGAGGVVAVSAVVDTVRFGRWELGPTEAAKLAVIGGSAVVALAVRLAARWLWRMSVLGTAAALTAGGAVIAIPATAAPGAPGVPLLTTVSLFGESIPVFVAPMRPGWNLVHLGTEALSAGTDRNHLVRARARPGAELGWADVWLPPGRSRLWIGTQELVAPVPVDTGSQDRKGPLLHGPDGPECASAALGGAVAKTGTALRSCPADGLSPDDGSALQAMVLFLAGRGEHAIALVSDSSARGKLAADTVRAAAGEQQIAIVPAGSRRVPLIVVSGWEKADAVVKDVASGRTAAQGAYLAPWLLSAPLLTPPAGQLIPLRFAPDQRDALTYVSELNAWFPGDAATSVGYQEWTGAPGGVARLYAASTVYVPGAAHSASHHTGRWMSDGAIVAVTGPLPSGSSR